MPNDNQPAKPGLMTRAWGFLRGYFVAVGILTTLLFILVGVLASQGEGGPVKSLPDTILLSYGFKPGLVETPGRPSLDQPLLKTATTLREITGALAAGAKDPRVKGLIARIDGPALSLAQIQELRTAVRDFRAGGKFARVYAESFSPGMGEYYLASAFGEIWLQPVGGVAITGLAAELPFGKELLDKIGVTAEFSHKGIYKSYPETMTRTDMSAPNREMMTVLIGDLASQIETGIAASRAMTPKDVRAHVNAAPFTDAAALKAKLVDRLGYYDEMYDASRAEAGVDDKGVVRLEDYAATVMDKPDAPKGKPRIALITGAGDIVSGDGDAHVLGFGGNVFSAGKIAAAFRAAEDDKDVSAVVFRVDSPGGSPEAAETVRRAVISMKKKGRPVIVSMGGYAASGGYWVSAAADKIVADPATVTGSIGVFGGKMDLSNLWKKVGVNWDSVSEGDKARMWSSNKPFSPGEFARFDAMLGNIYDAFIARVAEGRHMTKEKVEAVAEGRVWTGAQAKERGLVDELGGLDHAIALARATAKLGEDVPVVEFPRRKSGLDLMVDFLTGNEDVSALVPKLGVKDAVRAELARQNAVLRLPDVTLR